MTPQAQAGQRLGTALTFDGAVLSLAGLLSAMSGFRIFRIEVLGLRTHPILVLLVLASPLVVRRLSRLPPGFLPACVMFIFWWTLSCLQADEAAGEALKAGSGVFMVLAGALLVQTRRDFIVASTCFCVALSLMALPALSSEGLASEASSSLDALGNRNALSLYTLPVAALAGAGMLDVSRSRVNRLILVGCLTIVVVVTFARANRSGWLGLFIIGTALLISGRSVKVTVALVSVAALAFLGVTQLANTEIVSARVEATREGQTADHLRNELFLAALDVAIENPILGVSQQELGYHLAKRVETDLDRIDSHNLIGALVGGAGFPALFLFLAMGWVLWRWRPFGRSPPATFAAAMWVLKLLLVLWIVRGLFSREILFVPSFTLATGMALGMALSTLNGARRAKVVANAPQPISLPAAT